MNIIQVIIELLRRGDGAKQAREELEQLKESAEKTDLSTSRLHHQLRGLNNVFFGLSLAMSGAASGIRGIATAIGGFFQVIVAHPIGRLVASLITLGATLYGVYQRFRQSSGAVKENAEESLKAADAAQKLDKSQQALAEPSLRTAAEFAKQLADEFDRAAQAAARTRKNTDELADAELALKLATIDREVASGRITEDQGKQQRIEARLGHDQEKINREKIDVQNQISAAEKNIASAGEDYEMVKQEREKASAEYLEKRTAAAEKFPSLRTSSQDYSALMSSAKTREEKNAIIELNALKQNLQSLESGVSATGGVYYGAKEKYGPIIESGRSSLKTMETRSKASEISASAQSMEVSRAIAQKQIEEEKKKLTDIAAGEEKRQAALKEHEQNVFTGEKAGAINKADLTLDQQRAEEQAAKIQLTAAERSAGAKGQSPKQRTASAAALQQARAAYGKESSEVSQAKALKEKIQKTIDPADLAKLLNALETIGQAFKSVANAAQQQASQMKNGGLRTK